MEKREKIVNNNIIISLDNLTKALNEKFPSHHHAHLQVFMTFNTLYRLLLKEGVMSDGNPL